MSTRYGTIPVLNYIGIPQSAPTGVCVPSTQTPKSVPLVIDWNTYWQAAGHPSAVGIQVDLVGNTPTNNTLDKIRSIKIDNTFSVCPLFIYFGDTRDTITCAPQTVVTLPVNSNDTKLVIYAENLTAGFLPYTVIHLFNVLLPPVIDPAVQVTYPQWIGSPTIQRGNILTPGFGAPALGDQFEVQSMNLTTPSNPPLWGTPRASGFIYVTDMFASFTGCFNSAAGGGATQVIVQIFGTRTGILARCSCWAPIDTPPPGTFTALSLTGNVRLDATDSYNMLLLSAGITGGEISFNSSFSYVP